MKLVLTFLLIIFCLPVQAKMKINKIDFIKRMSTGEIIIGIKGKMNETPELLIKENIVQVSVPKSFVWPKIDKKIKILSAYDTTLMAYQFDKDIVRIRAVLPYSIKGHEGEVSLMLEENRIVLNFPILKKLKNIAVKAKSKKKKIINTAYDEKYLEELLSDSKIRKNKLPKKNIKTKSFSDADEVKTVASGIDRTITKGKNSFSIWTYVLKFLGFLGIILIGFYAVIYLMRKGVMKKGRLGFFNSSNLVEVLSTTHIAPKKSLLLIKAHKQVFLVSSTEKGMEFLSEINDVTGLIKNEEEASLGTNFDLSLTKEENSVKNFKLKEDLKEDQVDDSYRKGVTPKKAASKYSDQIKTKLKNLKPLQ